MFDAAARLNQNVTIRSQADIAADKPDLPLSSHLLDNAVS
jgi:hypothetical protein